MTKIPDFFTDRKTGMHYALECGAQRAYQFNPSTGVLYMSMSGEDVERLKRSLLMHNVGFWVFGHDLKLPGHERFGNDRNGVTFYGVKDIASLLDTETLKSVSGEENIERLSTKLDYLLRYPVSWPQKVYPLGFGTVEVYGIKFNDQAISDAVRIVNEEKSSQPAPTNSPEATNSET